MYLKTAFAALTCVILLTSACDNKAKSNESGGEAKVVGDEFTREWAEVSRKYPLVAAEFLRHRAALAEGVRFASAHDEAAYAASDFRDLVSNLPCLVVVDDAGNVVLRSVECERQPSPPDGGDPNKPRAVCISVYCVAAVFEPAPRVGLGDGRECALDSCLQRLARARLRRTQARLDL